MDEWHGSSVCGEECGGSVGGNIRFSRRYKLDKPDIRTTNQLNGVVSTGAQLVVTGNTGTVLTSPDGVTWIVRPTPGTINLNGAVWSPELSQLGVVGATGTVYMSP